MEEDSQSGCEANCDEIVNRAKELPSSTEGDNRNPGNSVGVIPVSAEALDSIEPSSTSPDIQDMKISPRDLEEAEATSQCAQDDRRKGSDGADAFASAFSQVSYLGSSTIEQPKSESEIQKLMEVLSSERAQSDIIEVIVNIPPTCDGLVKLMDAGSGKEMASFKLQRILFCARGRMESGERDCFAFTFQATTQPPVNFQLHAFRCLVPEAVGKILLCFATAFRRQSVPAQRPMLGDPGSDSQAGESLSSPELDFQFEAFLEMKEEDNKGGYVFSPQEKNCFKLRRGREKKVVVVLQQFSGPRVLIIQKCFGLLLAAGRNVRHSDMHLLDMQSMGRGNTDSVYVIEALWDPNTPHFEVLNTETPRDTRVFMTIAADVVLTGIHDPVRFTLECKARIFHQHERFWYITRKPIVERYMLSVRKAVASDGSTGVFEITQFESATERERKIARLSVGRSPSKMAAQLVHPADDDESDADEPLLSGSGDVNKDCSEEKLAEWGEILARWRKDLTVRPKEMPGLIRGGIPDALRGEVWQLLAGCSRDQDLMDAYRLLIGKECPQDQVIVRDIHRTFPAHDYFKEAGGVGQEALYKLSKAYALYDEEVGYCQGLSFLAASLLLHMPEEQAFCILVKIMFDYSMRDLFKLGFEALHLRFYQLERLIEDYIPDLHGHLYDLGVETHMYASQWFLTLFTAKFPLQMVFHIIDLFLAEGMNTIFHISLALLKSSKKELLQLDFEGVLKYFRVALPRKFRTEETAKELIMSAVKLRISHKRLSKYEKEHIAIKQQEAESQDPIDRLERENLRLKETNLRLERENDDLAHELVISKVELRNSLDAAEDSIENLQATVERNSRLIHDLETDNKRLAEENDHVKEMCRKELERLESETQRTSNIVSNYKQICSDLSLRLEKQQTVHKQEKKDIFKQVRDCSECSQLFAKDGDRPTNGSSASSPRDEHPTDLTTKIEEQEDHIRKLELELAETKLNLVESECRNQDLNHQLNSTQTQLESSQNTWFKKTISAVKEATTKQGSTINNPIKKDSSRESNLAGLNS